MRLLKEEADKEHPLALRALAVCYWSGVGVPQSAPRALALLKDAARGGDSDAQSLLGTELYTESRSHSTPLRTPIPHSSPTLPPFLPSYTATVFHSGLLDATPSPREEVRNDHTHTRTSASRHI